MTPVVEAGKFSRSHYANRYQQIPWWWGQFQVCQGVWADLGPILTYFGNHLNEPRHGLWVVFLAEWCVKVVATFLWEAYDCWRLWFLLPKLVDLMRHLDYTVPLGGTDTDFELHCLLDEISQVDWDHVPPYESSRSFTKQHPSFSPGRSHSAAGNFVWFNPWTSTLSSPSEAGLSRQIGNQITTPGAVVEHVVDPRAGDICPRPSSPSNPHTTTPAVSTDQLPVATPNTLVSLTPANPTVRLWSQVAPYSLSRTLPLQARTSSASVRIPLHSALHTEILSVREAPPSETYPTPCSPPRADRPLTYGPSMPTSIPSKENNAASSVYHNLLRTHCVEAVAL